MFGVFRVSRETSQACLAFTGSMPKMHAHRRIALVLARLLGDAEHPRAVPLVPPNHYSTFMYRHSILYLKHHMAAAMRVRWKVTH